MTPTELVGEVGHHLIFDLIQDANDAEGREARETARIVLDMLEPEHVGSIVRKVLADPGLSHSVYVRIKNSIAEEANLPEEIHTTETEVWFRNHEPPDGQPALLIATDGDDQRESLEELTRIAAADLRAASDTWVAIVSRGLPLTADQQSVWATALQGLAQARQVSLQQFANYVTSVRDRIADHGDPIVAALGHALADLRLPRDVGAFAGLKDTQLRQRGAWRRRYESLFADRWPLLTKHLKSGQLIDGADLTKQLNDLYTEGLLGPKNRPVFEAFISAPPQWCDAARDLAELEWDADHVSDFFSGIRQKQEGDLGTLTLRHFSDEGLPLTKEDEDYLKTLQARKSFKQSDDPADRDFYDRHVSDLSRNLKLKSKWDSFVFGAAVTCTDLLDGLIEAVGRLCARVSDWSVARELDIKVHGRGDRFFREMNADLAELFRLRYAGLGALFGRKVNWDIGRLADYPTFLAEQRARGHKRSTSTSRASTTVRLDLRLRSDAGDHVVQLHWTGRPDAVSINLVEDLRRLQGCPLLRLQIERNRVSRKGEAQRVSLENCMTFEPVYGQDAGSMVPREDGRQSWADEWLEALGKTEGRAVLSAAQVQSLRAAFSRFADAYAKAICALATGTVSDPSLVDQAEAYGDLLQQLSPLMIAEMDVPRRHLVEPILSLGVVQIRDRRPAAVVAPWHPLRMSAMSVKAKRVATFVNHVVTAPSVDFGDLGLFFRDFREQLQHPHYPEIVLGYRGDSPVLLVVTDTLDEYSLAEEPHPENADWRSDSDPTEAASRVEDTVRRYLELQPHEQANLSVAIYNCESAGLPIATIEALAALQESDVHCHVVLRHDDMSVLRRVYTELLEHADADPDALVASETSRNFMANLRVGIQLEAPTISGPRDVRAVDIAFLDDVVSRRASVKTMPAPHLDSLPTLADHIPGHWSYRVPVGSEQTRALRFLTCPEQPSCSLEQIRATLSVVDPVGGDAPYRLPVRELAFSDPKTATLLRDVHNLAEWVVNHDDLLEPDQLRNIGVQVIRYRRDATRGRNLIVSSTSQSGLLLALVQRRLGSLSLGIDSEALRTLAERLVRDATRISGEIALRATKRGEFAGELIGIVLSHALICEELGAASPQAWYFLDDYASWLGQREGGIADLVALSPHFHDGKIGLRIRVTEAKYISETILSESRKRSRSQLQNTVNRMREALFGNPGRMDRDLWLSRLSELLVQASHAAPAMQAFISLQRAVREGSAEIDLRGYSHVFVSTASGAGSVTTREELPKECGTHALQEVFGVDAVRGLLLRYFDGRPLAEVRESVEPGVRPWENQGFELPADRPSWARERTGASEKNSPNLATESAVPQVPHASKGAQQVAAEVTDDKLRESGSVQEVDKETRRKPQHGSKANIDSIPEQGRSRQSFADLVARHAGQGQAPEDSAWLDQTVLQVRQALTSYGLQAQVLGRRMTPNAALIRLKGTDRLQVRDIETRRSQLLTSHGLNVISVFARPLEVVLSVARPEREVVSLWDIWRQVSPQRTTSQPDLCLLIGLREIDGEPFYLNLGEPRDGIPSHAPHTLVAGTTGSGKSVLVQNLLLDLAIRNDPKRVRIFVIDPKQGVDYFALEALPHLEGGIIVEQSKALELLEKLVIEMDRRYSMFREQRVNKLDAFNEKVGPERALPVLFVVHDEFAEWMLTDSYRDAVSSIVSRLSVKARAAGIHLLFAAQRPDNLVMPMQLRDNLGNRLVLRVEGEGTSEIALGVRGAERLLGRGHLAARLSGESDVILGQVPFLSVTDAGRVVDAL